jgi:DMSO reductase family type II enzyme heme b subunit
MRLVSKWLRIVGLGCLLMGAPSGYAADGSPENGEEIYLKRCVGCHGVDGDGLGPGAERLLPPPRDFTSGMFKIMSTAFDGYIPQDQDIFKMIKLGMPGTAMPGWQDILSEQEMWDLVAYIKVFPGYDEEEPGAAVEYVEQVPSSEDSIAKGKELFLEDDRCSECHGEDGKGNAIKRLLGDNGERTWPRNLTKPWTFRHSNNPKDIFTRISVGIPGTQMPSFADPASKKVLTPEERWHVANYVQSLAKTSEAVNPENTVIKAARVDQAIPDDPYDEIWTDALPSTFFMVPQIIAENRHFTPSNDTITVRSIYTPTEIGILLEWDDRTFSQPGDEDSEKIGDSPLYEDKVAVQLPVTIPTGMEKPYFVMGDRDNAVNLWRWRGGTTSEPEAVSQISETGVGTGVELDAEGLMGRGVYKSGTWRVLFKRSLITESEDELQFREGVFIPIAFFAWDGSNGESGTKHILSTWYWLVLESSSSSVPFLGSLLALILVLGLEFLWVRSSSLQEENH